MNNSTLQYPGNGQFDYVNNNPGSYTNPQLSSSQNQIAAPNAQTAIQNAPNISPTSGVAKSTTGANQSITFMGKTYNLANPSEFSAYQSAVNKTPTNTSSSTQKNTTKSADELLRDSAQSELARRIQKGDEAFNNFNNVAQAYANGSIPLTAPQQAQIEGLKQQYQQLVNNQKLINTNASGSAAIRGYQKGAAEYDPTFNNKVINEIFSAGQQKVADLNNKMASAVASLTSAFQSENYEAVKDAYDEFQEYDKEQKATFQKTIDDAQARIAEAQARQREVQRSADVSELIGQGVTSPRDIMDQLRVAGADVTAKEVGDIVSSLISTRTYPGGIIGEYQFYVDNERENGRNPVDFNSYQNMDANRKISIARAAIDGTQLNDKDRAVFNQIVGKYQSSPAIQALDRANQLKNIIYDVRKNPENASSQLNLIYAYIKGLDTESAVREGEIDLVKGIQSYSEKYKNEFERLTEGKAISKNAALSIANASEVLINSIEDTAKRKEAVFNAQAKSNGTNVYGAWQDFSKGVKDYGSISDQVNDNNDEIKIMNYYAANPEKQEAIDNAISIFEKKNGREPTSSELLIVFPEIN